MSSTWICPSIATSCLLLMTFGCGPSGAADTGETGETGQSETTGPTTGQSDTSETGQSETSQSDTTGDTPVCDPSDPDIGPAVAVTIRNETDAALYLTEATQCMDGSPFTIASGGELLRWQFGICESCADALMGLCQCPGPCIQDTVIRVDPGGHYDASWPGGRIDVATLTPECVNESCGDQCAAITQADAGDYVAGAIASPMVTCDFEPCDCLEPPDPAGWCRINGFRAGTEVLVEAAFAYPAQTALELAFP